MEEPEPGYAKRSVPTSSAPVREIRQRMITNLFHERPKWPVDVHDLAEIAVGKDFKQPVDITVSDAARDLLTPDRSRRDECVRP